MAKQSLGLSYVSVKINPARLLLDWLNKVAVRLVWVVQPIDIDDSFATMISLLHQLDKWKSRVGLQYTSVW